MRYLFAILLFMSTYTFGEVYRHEYFAEFPFWESPVQPFKFASPLTKKDAQQRIHVQVGYDRQNRIIDIQTRQGDHFKSLGNFFSALYVHAVHTKVTYLGKKEIHRFYNKLGNRVTAWGNVWEKVYTKDQKKLYTKMEVFDRSNKPVNNSWGIANYTWQHQIDGSIVEERHSLKGELQTHRPGFEFERIRLHFDENGHLRLMQNIDDNHQLVAAKSGASQYAYFYDTSGAFERWEIFNSKDEPSVGPSNTAGEYYTRFADGSKLISFFNKTGGPAIHWSGAVHWKITRDDQGNILDLIYFDDKNQPANGNLGFAKIAYRWDEEGVNLDSKTFIDPMNQPTVHKDGYSTTKFTYTKQGLLKEQGFYDLENKLVVSSYEKAAIIRHR
jgi:hypothetical protein